MVPLHNKSRNKKRLKPLLLRPRRKKLRKTQLLIRLPMKLLPMEKRKKELPPQKVQQSQQLMLHLPKQPQLKVKPKKKRKLKKLQLKKRKHSSDQVNPFSV